MAKEAKGSAATGDDLCAWQGAGEGDVGAAEDSTNARMGPNLSTFGRNPPMDTMGPYKDVRDTKAVPA